MGTFWFIDAWLFLLPVVAVIAWLTARSINGAAAERARRTDELLLAILGELQDARR